jgi:hypothetical protein
MENKMKVAIGLKACNAAPLDQILSSTVVLNWNSLGLGSAIDGLTVDYHIGSDGLVESLKLWACSGLYWSLICDYAPKTGWADGPRFSNGYHCHRLGRLLQSILMNQHLFTHDRNPNSNGRVEIGVPTVQQTTDATFQIQDSFAGLQ